MTDGEAATAEISTGKWFVPSLVISFLAVSVSTPILMLLTVEMARSFQVPVGVAAQLSTINSVTEVVIALLMGALVVRFKHKSLLLVGALIVASSAVGSFLAPTFSLLLFFFAMEGFGTVMVGTMGFTLIGDLLSLSKKAKAISYVTSATYISVIVGVAVIGLIANVAGWRSVFLLFVLPVSVTGIALAFLSLPERSYEGLLTTSKSSYLSGFKQVLLNRSAVFCLLGGMLMSAMSLALFTIAFFMEHFSVQIDFASIIIMINVLNFALATIIAGRLINRVGRKNLTVAGTFGSSILTTLIFLMPNLWYAWIVDTVTIWFAAAGATAFSCYALEQVPTSRGTMMSLRSVFLSLGGVIGAALGGILLVLLSFNLALSYQAVGLAFGAIGIAASAIFYFLTRDPNKP